MSNQVYTILTFYLTLVMSMPGLVGVAVLYIRLLCSRFPRLQNLFRSDRMTSVVLFVPIFLLYWIYIIATVENSIWRYAAVHQEAGWTFGQVCRR
jgi:hypothetical protein